MLNHLPVILGPLKQGESKLLNCLKFSSEITLLWQFIQPRTCLWADSIDCIWLGLFSKLFKTSHLLKTNCFQAGVINGVLCSHLFNFAANKNASVFIQGPALLCTGWFTIQCVNVSSSLEQRRACLSKQIWGWGWRGKLRPVHWTAAWKQNETTTWGNVRGKMILKGFQPSVPCNFRVAPTQGAKASCRGTQVLPGPLEELYWQLKIFL